MILVHVQHFLDEAGKEYFPHWVNELAQTLKRFKGFISVSILDYRGEPGGCHLLMRFENEDFLHA